MADGIITAQRLRELLQYDPETGLFTWRIRQGRCLPGTEAGSLDNNGYVVIRLDWEIYKAGRLAWLYTHGVWPSHHIRYLDFKPSSNRLINLIDASNLPKRPKQIYPELTAELLRTLTHYDPETGIFSRISVSPINVDASGRYLRLKLNGKRYQLHRLAWLYMTGAWPINDIDHEDRDKHNNKFSNLREATAKQNQENILPRKGTVSGVTGICWNKSIGRWHVTIGHFGKRYFLGNFQELADAIKARVDGERKYFTHSPVCAQPSEGPFSPARQDEISSLRP